MKYSYKYSIDCKNFEEYSNFNMDLTKTEINCVSFILKICNYLDSLIAKQEKNNTSIEALSTKESLLSRATSIIQNSKQLVYVKDIVKSSSSSKKHYLKH